MNVLFSYPRSGMHLTMNLCRAMDIDLYHSHQHELWHSHWPLKRDDVAVALIRDYAECIPRECFPDERMNNDKIELVFKAGGNIISQPRTALQYIENLVIFETCRCDKIVLYYEDMMKYKKEELRYLAMRMNRMSELEELEWDEVANASLLQYARPMSGENLVFHRERIDNLPYFRTKMYKQNPYIYDKYLRRYEE